MTNIKYYDSDGKEMGALYQWDINQDITVSGISTSPLPVFHFCNRLSKKAFVVVPSVSDNNLVAHVPNVLLQQPEHIMVYICEDIDGEGYKTLYATRINVQPRVMPDTYIFDNDYDYISVVDIDRRVSELEERDKIIDVTLRSIITPPMQGTSLAGTIDGESLCGAIENGDTIRMTVETQERLDESNVESGSEYALFCSGIPIILADKQSAILMCTYDGKYYALTVSWTNTSSTSFSVVSCDVINEYDGAGIIPTGELDATSTSTVMTAQVSGITELKDGVCMWLRNNVVTSAQNFTLNINNLGAKPVYASNANATRVSGGYVNGFTVLFIYNSTRVSGGCWDYVYGFDSNTTYTPATLGFCYVNVARGTTPPAYIGTNASYVPANGGIVCINAINDIDANATLNISNKGASSIYYRGSAITSGVIKAGDVATLVYYSNRYYLLSVDRWGLEAFYELVRISSMSNTASDVADFIGGASVYVYSIDPGSDTASAIIAAQREFGDIYLNNANQPLQRGVIDNDGEKTFIFRYNLKTTETDSDSGFDVDDATKPAYIIFLSEDSEESSGYNLSCVSTSSLSGQTWIIGYPDEKTTRSYVKSAIQNAIGNAIGGSY